MRIFLPLILACVMVTGCATVTETGYYWGNYSSTLYKFNKNPSGETLTEHEEELHKILEYSSEKGLRVPPGIYAELGYINAKRGDDDSAKGYYESEMQNYPESRAFLERLISMNEEKF
jgi:hypothetical protein